MIFFLGVVTITKASTGVGLINYNSSGHERRESEHDCAPAQDSLPCTGYTGKEGTDNEDVEGYAEEG